MKKKEAKEIVVSPEWHEISGHPMRSRLNRAEGYLDAIEKAEVLEETLTRLERGDHYGDKSRVEKLWVHPERMAALEKALDNVTLIAKQALSQWKKEK